MSKSQDPRQITAQYSPLPSYTQSFALASVQTGPEEVPEMQTKECTMTTFILAFLLNGLFMLLIFPFFLGFYIVQPRQEIVVLTFGTFVKVVRNPGVHWYPPIGMSRIMVSTRIQTAEVQRTTVLDARGNPIVIGAVVTYRFVNAVQAAFGVRNPEAYVARQALAVLKQISSRYPYESQEGISLHSETAEVTKELIRTLQEKVHRTGARIISYELTDLQYAPEIAQGMLMRQQAQAMIEARKYIVEGAVDVVSGAVDQLIQNGLPMKSNDKARLVSNLLSIMCGESRVQPVYILSEDM